MKKNERTILSREDISRIITRMAHEIIEANRGVDNLAIVGILTRGDLLAKRLCTTIKRIENTEPPVGAMDINMYRDDWTRISHQPVVKPSRIPFSVDDKRIILIDDVLYTGRTIRAALEALMDFGRPSCIELGVLVDRGHRELPIQADYKGVTVNTGPSETVNVVLEEQDGEERVYIEQET
ncbi:MAG: bifunctional pyr operon transcriptional regulator/uracil phosphoribosyltransferase PyrR [Desulfobacteraceae bacterium]